jgi:hypothetical protein
MLLRGSAGPMTKNAEHLPYEIQKQDDKSMDSLTLSSVEKTY